MKILMKMVVLMFQSFYLLLKLLTYAPPNKAVVVGGLRGEAAVAREELGVLFRHTLAAMSVISMIPRAFGV